MLPIASSGGGDLIFIDLGVNSKGKYTIGVTNWRLLGGSLSMFSKTSEKLINSPTTTSRQTPCAFPCNFRH